MAQVARTVKLLSKQRLLISETKIDSQVDGPSSRFLRKQNISIRN